MLCTKSGSTRKGSRLMEEEKSIKDPDQQTSHTSTTNEEGKKKQESTFYSFEPIETSVREEEEEEDSLVGKISKEEKEVEEELREAVNAERSLRRALGEEEEGEEEVLVWEACPRIVKKEQSDYFEFLVCRSLSLPLSMILRKKKRADEKRDLMRESSCVTCSLD